LGEYKQKTSVSASDLVVVTATVSVTITNIQTGSYIGTGAVAEPAGSLRTPEVQVIPEATRGSAEAITPGV
jgi:hypothetical protein